MIRPDVLVKGGTYTPQEVVGREIVEAYGGQVRVTGVVDGISTTQIVGSLQSVSRSLASNEEPADQERADQKRAGEPSEVRSQNDRWRAAG